MMVNSLGHTAGLTQLRKMKAKLLKRMVVDGKVLDTGKVVDVSKWRNVKTLLSNRYIELVIEQEKEVKVTKEKDQEEKD